jgi:hypothetical protein
MNLSQLAALLRRRPNALIIASATRSASALIAQSRAALANLSAHLAPASGSASVAPRAYPYVASTSPTLLGDITSGSYSSKTLPVAGLALAEELLLNSRPPHAAREARLAVASRKFRFARDSPLEGDGFELPVPRQRRHPSPTAG